MSVPKATFLKILNPLMFLTILVQISTGVGMQFFFTLVPWAHKVHIYSGYTMMALVFLHLLLNWDWIRSIQFGWKKK